MNRSILLVICDFLLLSMLAIARFDDPEETTTPEEVVFQNDAPPPESELIELLQLSLEEEQAIQNQLKNELEDREETIEAREALIAEKETAIAETQEALQTVEALAAERQQVIDEAEQHANEIASALEQTAEQKAQLEESLSSVELSNQVALERLRQTEASLAEAKAEQEALETEKAVIEAARREVEQKAQELSTELRVAETERNLIAKNLENAQIQLETVQIEKRALQQQTERLTEGVSNLAETSKEIRKEIQESQPLSPANIFSQFRGEQVTLQWRATYSGVFGARNRTFETRGVRVETPDGPRIFFQTDDTPFKPSIQWSAPISVRLEVSNMRGERQTPNAVLFSSIDPRIGTLPITNTSTSPIRLSKDPFRFDRAVVIRPQNGYYGETGYRLSPRSDLILDMDSRILSGLFGDFNARQGDFVFALTGNLAAIMVNGDKAVRVATASSSHSILLNNSYKAEQASRTMDDLNKRLSRLPSDLR